MIHRRSNNLESNSNSTMAHQRGFIPISNPALVGNELQYVTDCVATSWISSVGKYVAEFENAFADFCGVKHAVTCSNGTTALHLALLALGVNADDEVIVPTLTYVATANAVVYCGARPVFVDSEPGTWNIDASQIESLITPRTKGIIVVHLFGHPVDMDPIHEIAMRHRLFVLEDAAEAHGAEYKGCRVGSIGDAATFSFFGNKIITTGEGGMVTTNNQALAEEMRRLKNHGMDPERKFWFTSVGYNYRLTNVACAIGLAQLEKIEWHLEQRRLVAAWYREFLADLPGIACQAELDWARHVWWLFTIIVGEESPLDRFDILRALKDRGIEARQIVYPITQLPPYRHDIGDRYFPIADRVVERGIQLPTWCGLRRDDVQYICQCLKELLRGSSSKAEDEAAHASPTKSRKTGQPSGI
jgi:perosamine synthetase